MFDPQNPPLPQQSGFPTAYERAPRWDERIKFYELPSDGSWRLVRFIGNLTLVRSHWFETKTRKKFAMICPDHDLTTGQKVLSPQCPACNDFEFDENTPDKLKKIRAATTGYTHVIVRDLQKNPSHDPKFRPWAPIRLPWNLINKLGKAKELNKVVINGVEYSAHVNDKYYGRDVYVAYNGGSHVSPADRYMFQIFDSTAKPLSDVEMSYLNELHDWPKVIIPADAAEIKRALHVNGYYQLATSGKPQQSSNQPAQDFGEQMKQAILPQMGANAGWAAPAPAVQNPIPQAPPAPTFSTPSAPAFAPAVAPSFAPTAPAQQPLPSSTFPTVDSMPTQPFPSWNEVNAGGQAQHQQAQQAQQAVAPSPVLSAVINNTNDPNYFAATGTDLVSVPAPAPAAASSNKTFRLPGHPEMSLSEFADFIKRNAPTMKKALPFKLCDRGDLQGIEVYNCFGGYRGDAECLRCPVRKHCLV